MDGGNIEDNIKILLNNLVISFSGTSTEEIKNAEKILSEYEEFIIKNLSKLMEIFYQNQVNFNTKKALSIKIKQTLISKNSKYYFDRDSLLNTIYILINSILNPPENSLQIEDAILEQILIVVVDFLSNGILVEEPETCITLNKDFINTINEKNCYNLFSLLIALISSKATNINSIKEITSLQLKLIQKYIKVNNNKILCKIMDLLSVSLRKLSIYNYLVGETMDNYIKLLIEDLQKIIEINCSEDKNIVSFINEEKEKNEGENYVKQISEINKLKSKVLLIFSFFIQFDKDPKIITNELSISCLNSLLKFILNSLKYIIDNKINEIENNLTKGNYEIILYYSLFLISRCVTREPFKMDFKKNFFEFIIKILFPLLKTNKNDLELLEEKPEEYYAILLDSMIDFKLKSIKTVCGYLLTTICEESEELTIEILNFIIQILTYNIKEMDNSFFSNYNIINNSYGEYIIKNFPKNIIIDTSLLFICILAKQTLKNKQVNSNLRNFLILNQNYLHDMTSTLLQFKICLIYALFIEDLFCYENETDNIFVMNAFKYLLNLILQYNKNSEVHGICYQALHTFEILISNDLYSNLASSIIRKKINDIINQIPNINIDIFFDVLCSIITNLNVEDYVLTILKSVIDRFKNDVDKSKLKTNTFIVKECNLIQKIFEKYYDGNNIQMENLTNETIFVLIKHIENLEFSDNIFLILRAYTMNNSGKINKILFDSFPYYSKYIIEKGEFDKTIFNILNYILLNDKENLLNTNNQVSQYFISLLDIALNMSDEYTGEPSPLYTLLLISIWILNGNLIETNILVNILDKIIEKYSDMTLIYKDKITNIINTYDFYLNWFYLTVFYSAFIKYPKITFECFHKKNNFSNIISFSSLLYNYSFYSTILGKICILGLSNILYENEILKEIIINFKDIFLLTFNILSKQLEQETLDLKKLNEENKEIEEERYTKNEEEEENEEEEYMIKLNNKNKENENNDDIKIKQYIKEGKYPIDNIDEFHIFKKLCEKLNSIDETREILSKIINNLSEEEKENFNKVVFSKRINIKSKDISLSVPRRIYKLKRNKKN